MRRAAWSGWQRRGKPGRRGQQPGGTPGVGIQYKPEVEVMSPHSWMDMDGGEGDDQARPGVQGVVVEDGEAGRDGDGHNVLESAHCGVDFPKVRLWHQF